MPFSFIGNLVRSYLWDSSLFLCSQFRIGLRIPTPAPPRHILGLRVPTPAPLRHILGLRAATPAPPRHILGLRAATPAPPRHILGLSVPAFALNSTAAYPNVPTPLSYPPPSFERDPIK